MTKRILQPSVTCFLHCGEEYLMLKRNMDKSVDPGKLNGVGGKVDPGENFVTAAIRETHEECGIVVTAEQVSLSGMVRLEGGYKKDRVMAFFRIEVPTKELPLGAQVPDGELLWIHQDEILQHDVIDDLHYCFDDIIAGQQLFFLNATVNDEYKVVEHSKTYLAR